MNKMKKLAAAVVLALAAVPASAATGTATIAVSGGSITLPEGVNVLISSIFENAVDSVGDELSGVGEILAINGLPTSSFCSPMSCELTLRFENYIVSSILPGLVTFTGGEYEVYLAFGADVDFNPDTSASSAEDLAAATNGSLFLTLDGHPVDAAGNTLIGTAISGGFLTPDFAFTGTGQLDVSNSGGAADGNFDTNMIPSLFGGNADMVFVSGGSTLALTQPHPLECPGGPECVVGSATITTFVIPEPGTLALLGIALSGLGLGLIRRRRTS